MSHHWEEYPLAIKEEILADPNSHDALIASLVDWPMPLGSLQIDSIPGYRLLEILHPGQSLHCVYLAITDPGVTPLEQRRAVCIKVAELGHLRGSTSPLQWIDGNASIQRETEILERLSRVRELQNKISRFLASGSVAIGPIEAPYLVIEYVAGVRKAKPSDFAKLTDLQELLAILREIHRHGIVHGDLTLENFMLPRAHPPGESSAGEGTPWRIIDFGSAFTRPRWGTFQESKRPTFAHRLAGALDEIQYACPPDASYDVACLALLIQEATELSFADLPVGSRDAIAAYWARATDPRPELRPQDAAEFRQGLERIRRRARSPMPWSPLPRLRASIRRNPRVATLALVTSGFWAFASSYAYYQHRINEQTTEQNARLDKTVNTLIRRNASTLRQFTELAAIKGFEVSQSQAEIDSLIDESLAIWENAGLQSETRIAALRLLLDVSDSMSEVQKMDASHGCLTRCLQAIEQSPDKTIATDPMVQLLRLRAASKLVRLAKEYHRPLPNCEEAADAAQRILREYLHLEIAPRPKRLPIKENDIRRVALLRESLLCAENLLANALYVFRGDEWTLEPRPLLKQVYDHAIDGIDAEAVELASPLASLEVQYGFMIHKGFTKDRGTRVGMPEGFSQQVQSAYHRAQALIDGPPSGAFADEDRLIIRGLRERIPNNLGMSLTQEQRSDEAREAFQKALALRRKELALAPNSLVWLKRTANTSWNLADSYLSELNNRDGLSDTDRMQLTEASLTHRHETIALCKRWLERDRSRESETAYLANALRGFRAELAMGRLEEGRELLRQAEQMVDLQMPVLQHSGGEELLLGAALLHVREPGEVRYRTLYEQSIPPFTAWLLDEERNPPKLRIKTHREYFARLADTMRWEVFAPLSEDSEWRAVMEIADRIADPSP